MTEDPPPAVPPVTAKPPAYDVPPLTETPLFNVGVPEVETTRDVPPLAGVLKQRTGVASDPLYKAYHVFLLHDEAL